nr:hypothetical protein [uncultured Desulfuromonas sp.]
MSLFSVICEAKIQDWFKRKQVGEIQPVENPLTIDQVKSSESYLLEDILRLIEQARFENGNAREIMLRKAKEMEIQLLMSLENEGYTLMAQMTAETIRQHKVENAPQK